MLVRMHTRFYRTLSFVLLILYMCGLFDVIKGMLSRTTTSIPSFLRNFSLPILALVLNLRRIISSRQGIEHHHTTSINTSNDEQRQRPTRYRAGRGSWECPRCRHVANERRSNSDSAFGDRCEAFKVICVFLRKESHTDLFYRLEEKLLPQIIGSKSDISTEHNDSRDNQDFAE